MSTGKRHVKPAESHSILAKRLDFLSGCGRTATEREIFSQPEA